MLRAVIYARFSSDMQREESIDAQVRACQEHCNRRHYIVTNIYKDEARSGKSIIGREGYNQMMADAMEHKFDVIIFHKIDRNARNEFNYYSFKNTLAQLGISYEYAAQNIDFTPEGQMMENMLVGFAAYYSRNLSKETKKGLNENAYKAQFNGGTPPLGYRIENKHYVIDEHEAEAVRMIFSMYLNGKGYATIAYKLQENGYKTKDGRNFSKNSIYDILDNEKYIGVYSFNRTSKANGAKRNFHSSYRPKDFIRIENALPAIVSEADFYAVQEKKKNNRHRASSYTAKANYLLSGKIFCGCCGSAMSGHRYTPRKNKTYTYYGCLRKDRTAPDRCPQKQLRQDVLEKWVLTIIEKEVFSEQAIAKLVVLMREEYNKFIKATASNKENLLQSKASAERKLNNLYNIIENGAADQYDLERLSTVKKELSDIKEKLDNLQSIANYPELTEKEIAATLAAMRDDFSSNQSSQKFIIDLLVDKITVKDKQITLLLNTNNVSTYMVPRTGIEPVRVSLPEGF